MRQNKTQLLKGDVKPLSSPAPSATRKQLSRRMMQLSQWNSEPAQQIYALIQTDATIQSKLGQASSLLFPFLSSHSLPNNTSCLVAWNERHFPGRERCLLVLLSDTDMRKCSSNLTGSCRSVAPNNKARACHSPPKNPSAIQFTEIKGELTNSAHQYLNNEVVYDSQPFGKSSPKPWRAHQNLFRYTAQTCRRCRVYFKHLRSVASVPTHFKGLNSKFS